VKILHVCETYLPTIGGAEQHIFEICKNAEKNLDNIQGSTGVDEKMEKRILATFKTGRRMMERW
jgi:hypothetical protein